MPRRTNARTANFITIVTGLGVALLAEASRIEEVVADFADGDPSNDDDAAFSLVAICDRVTRKMLSGNVKASDKQMRKFSRGLRNIVEVSYQWSIGDMDGDNEPDVQRDGPKPRRRPARDRIGAESPVHIGPFLRGLGIDVG